jgi:hypothetical protein
MRRKGKDSAQHKTLIYQMGNAPNVITSLATHIVTPVDMTYHLNMRARPVNGKTATRIVPQSKTRCRAPNVTASTIKAPDSVGGPDNQCRNLNQIHKNKIHLCHIRSNRSSSHQTPYPNTAGTCHFVPLNC